MPRGAQGAKNIPYNIHRICSPCEEKPQTPFAAFGDGAGEFVIIWRLQHIQGGTTHFTVAFALAPDEADLELPHRRDRRQHLQSLLDRATHVIPSALRSHHLKPLIYAADEFLVSRTVAGCKLKTVIAGYPWFADWGRDTMIALPGLMLTTGRFDDARSCLETFATFVSEGMVPNRFDDNDARIAHYNTVDASLWYLHAVRAYAQASGKQLKSEDVLLVASKRIIAGYECGTRFGIGVDPVDGLVFAGDAKTQLTWMDALRDGIAFTPRHGKCVEINALWCNGFLD